MAGCRIEEELSCDEAGRFHFPNVQAAAQKLQITGVKAPYYVKQVLYNGTATKLTTKRR